MSNNRELSELLDRISKSDSTALREFEKNYSRIIFAIAYSICKNKEDAEDISQNVLLKLIQLPEDKFPNTGYKTWLYILVKNASYNYLRGRRDEINIDKVSLSDSCSNKLIDQIEGLEAYDNMVSKLNDEERTIVSLKVLCGMKHREIALLLNKPTGTIRWLYSKALYSIRITLVSVFVFGISLVTTLFRSGRSRSSEEIQLFNNFDFWLGLILVISLGLALLFGMSVFQRRCKSNKT